MLKLKCIFACCAVLFSPTAELGAGAGLDHRRRHAMQYPSRVHSTCPFCLVSCMAWRCCSASFWRLRNAAHKFAEANSKFKDTAHMCCINMSNDSHSQADADLCSYKSVNYGTKWCSISILRPRMVNGEFIHFFKLGRSSCLVREFVNFHITNSEPASTSAIPLPSTRDFHSHFFLT